MSRPAGFIIDVPVTLSVAVRSKGKRLTEKEAIAAAEQFFSERLARIADDNKTEGYSVGENAVVTEFSLDSPSDESSEVLDELPADDADIYDGELGNEDEMMG